MSVKGLYLNSVLYHCNREVTLDVFEINSFHLILEHSFLLLLKRNKCKGDSERNVLKFVFCCHCVRVVENSNKTRVEALLYPQFMLE